MILRAVARIEATLEQQNVILKELKNGGEKTSRREEFSFGNTSLPISTMEEFYELKPIEPDPRLEKLLYCRLASIGGINIKMAAKLILDTCLTKNMQKNSTGRVALDGKKTNERKVGFKSTKFCAFITPTEEIGKALMV